MAYVLLRHHASPVHEEASARPGNLGSTLAAHTFIGFAAGILSPVIFGAFLDIADDDIGWGLGFSSGRFANVIAIGAMPWLRAQADARPAISS